ncbi:hypothetical protein BKA93DRAFT_751503 [Sparassis latifolia]
MGVTGTGKSTFVNTATAGDVVQVGHMLKACTSKIVAYRCLHPQDGHPVVFIDTPSFDDTTKSETDILNMLAEWLSKIQKKGMKLAGIIYLHRISDNRGPLGTRHRNVHAFRQLCGDKSMQKVILATTMWETQKAEVAEDREKHLQATYWKQMLDGGSATSRFYNSFNSAWSVVDALLSEHWIPDPRLLQEELADLEARLSTTSDGVALYNSLQEVYEDATRLCQNTLEAAELNTDLAAIAKRMRGMLGSLGQLHVPLGRHSLMFFTYRSYNQSLLRRVQASSYYEKCLTTRKG